MLVDVDNGFVNIDQVCRIENLAEVGKRRRLKVYFSDGSTAVVPDTMGKLTITGQLVPAPSGFQLVHAGSKQNEEEMVFWTEPVIAFRIDGTDEYGVVPVTPTGEHRADIGPKPFALVFPDGRCFEQEEGFFESVDAWKANTTKQFAPEEAAAS